MIIKTQKVTKENFKKFGKLVTQPKGKPTSEGTDYRFWSDIVHYQINEETEIGICQVFLQARNIIAGMERHLHTPEILIPIDAPFVVPLLLEGEKEEKAKAFQVDLGEAIVVNAGVWHGACLPVRQKKSSYFVIFRRKTPYIDVEKKSIKQLEIKI